MNENRNAEISALMDGALGDEARARLLTHIGSDPEQHATWHRFHLIGDALRGDPVLVGEQSLAANVMARLADEPTVLVPNRRSAAPRRVITGAIAASVALLAVFGLQGRVEQVSRGELPAIAGLTGSPSPASDSMGATATAARPVDAEVLQRYFMSHSELRATQAVRPQPPHASLVGFSPEPEGGEVPPEAEEPRSTGPRDTR
ncbi:MAG TPA: hypothetical protein DCY89_04670 [Gammaproteobacteria bacterium]|nr:hypothetical protein [Gammaproteobacteria bacterium]